MGRSGGSEAEVCLSSEIGPLIEEFERRWYRERPNGEVGTTGPLTWLSWETGLQTKVLSNIRNQKHRTVLLSIAEAILMAMDKGYMISNEEVAVEKNPRWSLEKYMAYMEERGCI